MFKFFTLIFLFSAILSTMSLNAFGGDRSFDSYIKIVGHRKYQRAAKVGKITFFFSDESICKIDDSLQKRIVQAIDTVDALFSPEDILETVVIDEWCEASWVETNKIVIGQNPEEPAVSAVVIAHEYAHAILGKKLGYKAHLLTQRYMQAYSDFYCLGCQPSQIQNREFAAITNQMLFQNSLHEYFADIVSLTTFDTTIASPELLPRDFSHVMSATDIKAWQNTMMDSFDTHHALQPIWYESLQLIEKTKGNPQAKRKFLSEIMRMASDEIQTNVKSYFTKSLDLIELNRITSQRLKALK